MEAWLVYGAVAVGVVLLARAIRLSTRLFAIRIRRGVPQLVSGRLPHALYADIADIAARQQLDEVWVLCVQRNGAATLDFKGPISETAAQQVRNVVGRFRLVQLKTGTRRA
jgi:hypothetical protein